MCAPSTRSWTRSPHRILAFDRSVLYAKKKSTVVETMDQNQNGEQIPADEAAFCTTLCPDWCPDDDRPLQPDELRQWARKNPQEACRLRERAKLKRARGLLDHSDERVLAALE